jgi:antitoxin (DNA-binding transcriptional repressor) of toxin-antitoxin stability system
MIVSSMHAAKSQLSRLVAAAERGEEVRILRGSTPVAELVPYQATAAPGQRRDRLAPHPWRGTVSGSFFDDPTQPLSNDEWPETAR